MTVQDQSPSLSGSRCQTQHLQHPSAYAPDVLATPVTVLAIILAGLGGGLFTLASWLIIHTTNLPAFGPSNVTRALSSLGSMLVVLVTGLVVYFLMSDAAHARRTPRWRQIFSYFICYLSPAALVVTTLAIPLSATSLYLSGVTVDQGFRTQFLTRLTDSWQLSDMNYIDMPSYYPGMWFWFGGRLGDLLNLPGWEVFQPWAMVSIALAGSVLVPVWQRLTGSLPVATAIALVSVCIAIVTSAEEPYAAIIALGVPAATIMVHRALVGGNLALVGMTLYLGISASSYTLYTAVVALSCIVVAACFAALVLKSFAPVLRLGIMGIGSMLLAAIWWAPYLYQVFSGAPTSGSAAQKYLPLAGSQFPLPMLIPDALGVICLIGLIYLLIRWSHPDIATMGISLMVFYGWITLSMAVTLTGTTLLGFRLDAVVALIMATAGVLGLAELRLLGVHRLVTTAQPGGLSPGFSQALTTFMVVILSIGGVSYVQNIPNRLAHSIDLAYTDTDGRGHRADLYPPNAEKYYPEIADTIMAKIAKPAREIIVLTDQRNLLAFHPFRGYQAFTSHYANPLGEFEARNAAIESWAEASWKEQMTGQDLITLMEHSPWRIPDAIVLRGDLKALQKQLATGDKPDGWIFDIAEDIYPNNPNVRFKGSSFNPAVFLGDNSPWEITPVGSFVVVTRQ
ncbi:MULTISPECIES: galactan 5-O-arabinofuranosyltransferase [unclassified Corynebacterium]|uniref:galactan 5-O-arabinofuranosyltransferase n=1 Tax=unclassified Corynebacterium TaxID=2624378 RepID=UPI0021682309|nr:MULTISPECIES: galactan 5-O-arabinofuranosyltransferase [unclassified Corynebacterium]MCS4490385.1 galactan 5-O-arabinofuranosyltransferase [Corynebacterium sp. ES2775-CONJ]MCS4492165.1 galactan 5-O-arabinofuranosyltransferase [Corynebacterium sp. ES2715-CONJ3]